MGGQCNIEPSMGETDRYRLAPVQKVRALDERAKQGDLAGAVGDAKKTQATIDAATARVEAIRATIDRARSRTNVSTASSMAIADRYLARLRRDLEAALDELDRATAAHRGQLDAVDAARVRLGRARADKELIERHFARWRDEKRKLADRRED
jgi:small-conductance mechanosensitive channel